MSRTVPASLPCLLALLLSGGPAARAQITPELDSVAPLATDTFMVVRPRVIYFPPNPPPVGLDVLPRPASTRNAGPRASEGLREFITEPFYAPISSYADRELLWNRGVPLSETQRNLLRSFLEIREAQRNVLHAKLASLERASPAARRRELIAFAPTQTPVLLELEATAEKLRSSLAQRVNWNEYRQWRLGRGRYQGRDETVALEFELLRAAAYYQEGLSPAQRRLAREFAMELGEKLVGRDSDALLDRVYLAFSPETARIRLPRDPAPELAELIERYRDEKTALKREISNAVYDSERMFLGLSRNIALRKLAEEHAPRIAALEELAEEIRMALVAQPGYPRVTSRTTIPISLFDRMVAFSKARQALENERRNAIARGSAAAEAPSAPPETRQEVAARDADRRDRARRASSDFDVANTDRLRELDRQAAALQEDLRRVLPAAELATLPEAPEQFIFTVLLRLKQRAAYTEYDVAVLEPGLSPPQRRLLFGSAIEALNLPLPGGELQPTRGPGTLLPPD